MATEIIFTVLLGSVFAEVMGYFLHMLLHSNKIKFLSKNHMIHHLKLYGPKDKKTSNIYKDPVEGRASIFGLGAEWFVPVIIVITAILFVGWLLKVRLLYLFVFLGTTLVYSAVFFSYAHDIFHIDGIWVENNRFLKDWLKKARRLHFIHHEELSDDGRMHKNYGISFYFLDKLFGTYSGTKKEFNEKGYRKARERYGYIFRGWR